MGTLIEEIFARKAGRPVQAGEILLLDVDYIMSHDNTTPLAIKAFRDIGKPIHDKSKIVIHFDHAYPAPNILAAENHKKIIEFVKEQGLPHLLHQGVCHQVMIEVESQVYTSAVVRRMRGFAHVSNVYEITGDYDISTFVNVENVAALNNLIEEIRTVQGVKRTETRMVLKKYNGNGKT